MARKDSASALLRACRVQEPAHRGDAIGRKAYAFGVFLDRRLVRGEIDAVHFVPCHVAMEPLNLRTHSPQNADRLLGNFSQLGVGQFAGSRNFTFDDEFRQGHPSDVHRC